MIDFFKKHISKENEEQQTTKEDQSQWDTLRAEPGELRHYTVRNI